MTKLTTYLALAGLLAASSTVRAFPEQTCGDQQCIDCHVLTKDEAREVLRGLVEDVLAVNPGEIKGLWQLDVAKGGRKFPIYLDYSRTFLVSGEVIRLGTMEDLTRNRMMELNRTNFAAIPLEDALILGKPTAPWKVVVFDDPECPYCQKVFEEMKKVVAQRPDVAFYIKMMPLKIHPAAYEKAKAIICARSLQMLEDSLAGRPVPAPTCETDQIEMNALTAQALGISSVPTLVYPDGIVMPGFVKAEAILQKLEEARAYLGASAPPGSK